MFEYKWTIKKLHTQDIGSLKDVVVKVSWMFEGLKEDGTVAHYQEDDLLLDAPVESQFVSISSLNKSTVLNWVKEKVSEDDLKTAIESFYIQQQNGGLAQNPNVVQQTEEVIKEIIPNWN